MSRQSRDLKGNSWLDKWGWVIVLAMVLVLIGGVSLLATPK